MNRADAWLTLNCVPGMSPALRQRLLDRLGSPEAICEADAATLTAMGGSRAVARRLVEAVADGAAARERARAAELGAEVVTQDDPAFPTLLQHIDDPPAALFVRGTLDRADELAVAIVGARRCSETGRRFARQLAHDLAAAGCTIVSGGARGIDSAAHRGALEGGGRTLCVAGRGLAEPYPAENGPLFAEVATQGALLSEFPSDLEPRPVFFPWRNRIIAGMAKMVVVVEGRFKSGAAHTARAAQDYNRDVGGVPGRVGDALAELPNGLVHDGATLVLGAEDVLRELSPFAVAPRAKRRQRVEQEPPSGPEAEIYAVVGSEPRPIADIAARCGRPAPTIMALLTRLELSAHIRSLPGGRWVRA